METPPYGDHVKRSHTATSAPPAAAARAHGNPAFNPRRKYKRRGTGSVSETKSASSEDEVGSSMSESEEHELGALDSDADLDDEESGMNRHDGRRFLRRKRRRNGLDSRIAGSDAVSRDEAKEADNWVLRNLFVNAALIGGWYFFSLSISIYNKMMFSSDHLDFHFPLFATSLHMLVQFSLASLVLLLFPSFRPAVPEPPRSHRDAGPSKRLVTPLFYLTRLVPCGTTTSLDIGLGNTSLRFITLTFYTMCKSSVLIFVLMFAFLFRLEKPTVKLTLIILTMTAGVLMMAAGETAFHALGFALAMSASFFSGFRWALTQILLVRHPATSNPFATLFFLSPIMFVTLFTIACFSETPSAVLTGIHLLVSTYGLAKTLLLLIVPGFLAFCMIASEFTLLQRTSVVTLSICGIFKEVVTISAAGIVFHDELSVINVTGLLVTIVSIATYNYLKITKMREEARARLRKKDEDASSDLDDELAFDDDDDDHENYDDHDNNGGLRGGAHASRSGPQDAVPLMLDQEGTSVSRGASHGGPASKAD